MVTVVGLVCDDVNPEKSEEWPVFSRWYFITHGIWEKVQLLKSAYYKSFRNSFLDYLDVFNSRFLTSNLKFIKVKARFFQ